MAGTTADFKDIFSPDKLGSEIAGLQVTWNNLRATWRENQDEVMKYVFAVDTTTTTNNKLPWKNKTTLPKLCQIRDNLRSNYMASLFPRRKNVIWVADNNESNTLAKRQAIESYMKACLEQSQFKREMSKCIDDYIDYGNAFAMPEWYDGRVELPGRRQAGYVGPTIRRISPLDIVFNPIASSFERSPKIIRSLISMGEVKEMLERLSLGDDRESYQELFQYFKDIRGAATSAPADTFSKDAQFQVDGFNTFQAYLGSNYVEVLTFYGDIYDEDSDTFLKNYIVQVVDRHKVISKRPNESIFGHAPIYHVGWRPRPDNLWAMSPLSNLVGMQYRIDHVENLKADVFDLLAAPPLKIKGYVEDFVWAPFSKIHMSEDADVEVMAPAYQILQANLEIQALMAHMEELAGSPKETMGFRTPGEKTAFEVSRLENASSRIFHNKTMQFEELFVEPLQNGMLALGRSNITTDLALKVFNDDYQVASFLTVKPEDLVGVGRIRPVAARHFAESATIVQNITQLSQTQLWASILPHVSGWKLAKALETVMEMEDFGIFTPFVGITEKAEADKLMATYQEQLMNQVQTPSGLTPDDFDQDEEQIAQSLSQEVPSA